MKKVFLAILILLLAGTQMVLAEDVPPASVWDSYVCEYCGGQTKLQHDSTHHWLECVGCGMWYYQYCHYTSCDDLVFCTVCKASGVRFDYLEHGEDILKYNELYHWYECSDCGALSTREKHKSKDGGSVCSGCGASEGIYISSADHHYKYGFNDTSHWLVCIDCNDVVSKSPHEANCRYPNICTVCGAAGALVNIPEEDLTHNYKYTITESTHSGTCRDCGKTIGVQPHFRSCTSSGSKCQICGKKDAVGISVTHGRTTFSIKDAVYCNVYCWSCNESLSPELHDLDSTGTCSQCNMMIGDVNWDNAFNGRDILIMMQSIAGWSVEAYPPLCDTGSDGRIDLADLAYVHRLHANGK